MLALKALSSGTGQPLGGDQERVIEFDVNGQASHAVVISAEQNDVMKRIDLTPRLGPGLNRLTLAEPSRTGVGDQIDFSYHVPRSDGVDRVAALSIDVHYDRTDLRVGDTVTAEAVVVNNMSGLAPMVILDLPVPAGFAATPDFLADMVKAGRIAKYQLTARSIVVYLRGLPPGKPLSVHYRLEATMPVRITVPPARVYEYYDPSRRAVSEPTEIVVAPTA